KSAGARTCIEYYAPVCGPYWRADAVFSGQLIDIISVEKTRENQMPTVTVQVILEEPFRGVSAGRVDVETLHGTSCDMTFAKGERYLIYASLEQDGKKLFAGPCTRTGLLNDANDDLRYIRSLKNGEVREAITGRLVQNRSHPLSGLKVTLEGDGKTVATTTDENGSFVFTPAETGDYIVRAFFPFAAAVMAYSENEPGKIAATDTLTVFEYPVKVE